MSKPRKITTIDREAGKVKISRKDLGAVMRQAHLALGGDRLFELDAGKGRTITIDLGVWSFLLAVLEAAVAYSGYAGGRAADCCDEVCEGHGGCDFTFGSVAVCNDGDLIICTS